MACRENEDWFEAGRLHRAASDGNLPEMERLVHEGRGINVLDDLSRGPIHYAVEGENYNAVVWLLENGADVNLHDDERIGETPLSLAAQGEYKEMVELLLKNGADPDIKGLMAQTARSRAAKRKDSEGKEISVLIETYNPLRHVNVVRRKGERN